jgi:hypothetical protein
MVEIWGVFLVVRKGVDVRGSGILFAVWTHGGWISAKRARMREEREVDPTVH